MHKRILALLLVFSTQVYGSDHTDHSTSVFAEFLYWQISEVGSDNWAQVITPPGTSESIQFLDVPFQWDPGFRVGAAYHGSENNWDTLVYYTWYQTQSTNQASVTTGEIHSSFPGAFYANNTNGSGLSGPYYHNASIKWNFLLNNIDWELGRTFNIKNRYKLRPFVGLKAAFIDQSIHTRWQNPYDPALKIPITTFSSAIENITNDFWGVGPSLGLNTSWNVHQTPSSAIGLFGNFSGAFLWGGWHITDVYENNTPVTITVQNNVQSSTATMAKGLVGLSWQTATQYMDIAFRLGYEGQAWINQLKFYSFDGGRQNGTLYIQGGVLDVCIQY